MSQYIADTGFWIQGARRVLRHYRACLRSCPAVRSSSSFILVMALLARLHMADGVSEPTLCVAAVNALHVRASMCKTGSQTKTNALANTGSKVWNRFEDEEGVVCVTGAKRMRPPLQQQSGSNSSAYQHPSSEIALQQQMLKQQHSGGTNPVASGSLFGSLGQAGHDASQLQMHSQGIGVHSTRFRSVSQHHACLECASARQLTCKPVVRTEVCEVAVAQQPSGHAMLLMYA